MSQQAQASNRLGLGAKQTPVTQQGPALAAPPGVRDWKGDLSELGISDCTWAKVTPDFISREAPAERIPCDLCLRAEHGGALLSRAVCEVGKGKLHKELPFLSSCCMQEKCGTGRVFCLVSYLS